MVPFIYLHFHMKDSQKLFLKYRDFNDLVLVPMAHGSLGTQRIYYGCHQSTGHLLLPWRYRVFVLVISQDGC